MIRGGSVDEAHSRNSVPHDRAQIISPGPNKAWKFSKVEGEADGAVVAGGEVGLGVAAPEAVVDDPAVDGLDTVAIAIVAKHSFGTDEVVEAQTLTVVMMMTMMMMTTTTMMIIMTVKMMKTMTATVTMV